jgi:major membrane immunogen (membrane-anchored lipoprotein)
MKNKKLVGAVLVAASVFLISCGGGSSSSLPRIGNVDIQMLSNEVELKKVYDVVLQTIGDNITKMDEVCILVSSPAIEKGREDRENDLILRMDYLNPKDKNKLHRDLYSSEGGWQTFSVDIELRHDEDAESFVLEEVMFDMSAFSAEQLFKIVQDALVKYGNKEKYSVQYIKSIDIKSDGVKISIYSRLASNNIEQSFYYNTDFEGVEMK